MYMVIDEQNQQFDHLPRNGSLINFSMLRDLPTVPLIFRSFSVKYVLEGCEQYTVNGNKFHVADGQYLLANSHSEGAVAIDSEKIVKGICIDVAPGILSEVVASYLRPGELFPAAELDRFFTTPEFFENFYPADETHVGHFLKELGTVLCRSPFEKHEFSREFYFALSEKLVQDHIPVFRQLQSVRAIRTETRKELLRRAGRGKLFIDHAFVQPVTMAEVARECGLSEYHFFRLFRNVFGISPHQYLIRKRLEHARRLLGSGLSNVSEVAVLCGFSDIFSFSKSFKKHYGVSPSGFRQNS